MERTSQLSQLDFLTEFEFLEKDACKYFYGIPVSSGLAGKRQLVPRGAIDTKSFSTCCFTPLAGNIELLSAKHRDENWLDLQLEPGCRAHSPLEELHRLLPARAPAVPL